MYYTANSIKVSACKLGVRETVFRSSCDSDVAIKRVRTTAKYFNMQIICSLSLSTRLPLFIQPCVSFLAG